MTEHCCSFWKNHCILLGERGNSPTVAKAVYDNEKKKKPDHVVTEYFSVLTGKGLEFKLQKSGQIVFKVGDVDLIASGL